MHSVYYFPSFLSIAYYFYVESIINQLVGKLVDGVHAGGADYSSCLVRHNLAVIRRAAVVWLFCTLASVRIMLVLYLFRRTDNLVGRDFQRLCIHVDFNAVDGEAGVYVPVHAVEVGGIAVGRGQPV